jgi:opacity protein-like surface antigen
VDQDRSTANCYHSSVRKVLLFLLFAFAFSGYSQVISFGVKGGIPATNAFQSNPSGSYLRRYIVGPTVEIRLPFHLSFEADALYRRSGFSESGTTYAFGGPPLPAVVFTERARVNDWQVPFLGKWTPGSGPLRPFVDAGVTYRNVSGQSVTQFFSPPTLGSQGAVTTKTNSAGFTMGAGLALKVPLIRISPEIRYTHWPSPPYIGNFLPLQSSANQVDFLLGITF